jgi:hypothetical protein
MWWFNQRQEDEAAKGEGAGGGQAGAASVRRSQRWDEDGMLSCMYYHDVVLCRPHLWAYAAVRTVTLHADMGHVRDIVVCLCVSCVAFAVM